MGGQDSTSVLGGEEENEGERVCGDITSSGEEDCVLGF